MDHCGKRCLDRLQPSLGQIIAPIATEPAESRQADRNDARGGVVQCAAALEVEPLEAWALGDESAQASLAHLIASAEIEDTKLSEVRAQRLKGGIGDRSGTSLQVEVRERSADWRERQQACRRDRREPPLAETQMTDGANSGRHAGRCRVQVAVGTKLIQERIRDRGAVGELQMLKRQGGQGHDSSVG